MTTNKRLFSVLLVLSLFLLSTSVIAELLPEPGFYCSSDQVCVETSEMLMEFGIITKEYPLCDLATETCYSQDTPVITQTIPTTITNTTNNITNVTATPVTSTVSTDTFNSQITQLKGQMQELTTKVNSLEGSDQVTQQQLQGLNNDLQSIAVSIQDIQSVKSDLNSISVGLAGLQEGLNQTSAELNTVEETLAKKAARNKMLLWMGFVFLLLIVMGGVSYYILSQKRPFGRVDPKVTSYISQYIKQGWKYPHIKEKLMQSGWSEEEIGWAYKETIKKNYQEYQKKSSPSEKKTIGPTGVGSDRNKVITIAVVSVLLVIGAILIINGTTGNAIFFQKFNTGGEITYGVECTAPHVLNPDKDGCCLDLDNSGTCDYLDARGVSKVSSGGACADSFQCPQNEYCIDKTCQTLESQYKGFGDCSKQCNTYAARIKTSDGEIYPLKPGQGSYTGAGSLEWKVMEGPTHCKGEPALLPIKVSRKDQSGLINQEQFVLKQGETSKVMTHPTVPLSFTLTVERIFEWCPE
ncbi:hypothetical protein COY27_02380 [Candidatus Woesearchaeota archaeon CG_4_10_14_0_2_um_filter_33_13]|nr:MAG: hypothetical protein COY27_02380 [Candidatus Woesearchaeota archaeon CG_4_10_14_0_2_um_filter_33_13]